MSIFGNYGNIETRKFPGKDYYTAYASGVVYHVRKGYEDKRIWKAIPQGRDLPEDAKVCFAPTLAAMSARLKEVANKLEGKPLHNRD